MELEIFTNEENLYFERLWIRENNRMEYKNISKEIDDDTYIDYKIWSDINSEKMYKKHMPNTLVISGENSHIIFHGGCLSCKSQAIHGIDRCKGCQYFKANWNLGSLEIE